MKRIVFVAVIILIIFNAKNAQAQFGINLGYSPEFFITKQFHQGQIEQTKYNYKFQGIFAGLYYNFCLPKNLGIAVGGQLRWRHAHQTMTMDLNNQIFQEWYTNIYYLEIPVMLNYTFRIKQNYKLSLSFGPTIEYGLIGSIKTHIFGGYYSYDLTTQQYTYFEEDSWTEQKCFDSEKVIDRFRLYGLTGITFSYRHINLSTSYRYGFFNKDDTKTHTFCFYLGIGYCF